MTYCPYLKWNLKVVINDGNLNFNKSLLFCLEYKLFLFLMGQFEHWHISEHH